MFDQVASVMTFNRFCNDLKDTNEKIDIPLESNMQVSMHAPYFQIPISGCKS